MKVECKPAGAGTSPPLERESTWHLVAFDWYSGHWQHHVVNAAPMLGMLGAVLHRAVAAAVNITLLHSGLLTSAHGQIRLRAPPPSATVHHASLYNGTGAPDRALQRPLTNLLMAIPMPENEGEFSIGRPRERYSEGDWYPRAAYWPFRSAKVAAHAAAGAPRTRILFLSRAGARTRHLANETVVATALRRALLPLGLHLQLVSSTLPPAALAGVAGVVGVHGGAFANVHACATGATVLEIQSVADPRWCYAALARGVGLRYVAYYARQFPRSYLCPPTRGKGCLAAEWLVHVDIAHFVRFAVEVFSEHAVGRGPAQRGEAEATRADGAVEGADDDFAEWGWIQPPTEGSDAHGAPLVAAPAAQARPVVSGHAADGVRGAERGVDARVRAPSRRCRTATACRVTSRAGAEQTARKPLR